MKKPYPDWKAPSPIEKELNKSIKGLLTGPTLAIAEELLSDPEINLYHSYGNSVSIRRLGFNDHGPVHARIVTRNALKMLNLLRKAEVPSSLVAEGVGTAEDSQVVVLLGAFLHDVGMGVTRQDHEKHSVVLADHIIQKYLEKRYPDSLAKRVVARCTTHEAIVGHMAKTKIHSVEAGLVLAADGTDMTRGRSRIPSLLSTGHFVGDVHRTSANAIDRVEIIRGKTKPIQIKVWMTEDAGLFQIEEVLMTKLNASPVLEYIELGVKVGEGEVKHYLK